MEISHGTFDAVGMTMIVAAVAHVIANGPAHLEIERAVEADALLVGAIGVVAVFSQCLRFAIIDLTEDQRLLRSFAKGHTQITREVCPELVVDVFDGIDTQPIYADLVDVKGVDANEFINDFLIVFTGGMGPDVAEAVEIAHHLLTIVFSEAIVVEPFAAIGMELAENSVKWNGFS